MRRAGRSAMCDYNDLFLVLCCVLCSIVCVREGK